ncbi:hypothetical protein CR203_18070 [Salipaludibacillus neizhouensis]|uniref:Uncharacterized protein n=1 Tax=Salipaludibacillus neizhouensis TaxID=885475 RepID=A0A3A9KML1_9BACI|nr:thioesterase family protein [Salipaludibacillus neizhouensis]RKL65976.1 hypothetical protein CR203_18070 [Salipaludibacillus neizhouensis]
MKPDYIKDLETWKDEFQLFFPVSVRFSETDAFGHLNNTVSFVYFETARIEFFKETGLMQRWMSRTGENIPVTADLQCDYRKQIFFDEKLNIGVKVAKVGSSSLDLHYVILNENKEVCMTGRGSIVQVSKKTGKSSAWETDIKNILGNLVNL